MDVHDAEYHRLRQEINYLRDELARVKLQLAGTKAENAEWRRIFVTGIWIDDRKPQEKP